MTPRAPLRIGILGVARIGGEAVVLPAQALGHRLVGVASRDPARARFYAGLCGIERVLPDGAALLADPGIDTVYIPQVPSEHARWVRAAVAAGKHVLCEKPLCITAAEGARLREAARGAGTAVAEAWHHLCHPLWDALEGLLVEAGPLRSVEAELAMRPPPAGDPRWDAALGGGALADLGCYGVQAAYLLGRFGGGPPAIAGASATPAHGPGPDGARAGGARPGGGGPCGAGPPVDGAVDVALAFPGGATGRVRASITARAPRHRLTITCTRARIDVDGFVLPHLGGRLTVTRSDGTRPPAPAGLFAAPSTYTHQLRRFAAHVRTGAPMPWGWTLDDSVAVLRLLDDARAAAGAAARHG